MWQSLRKTVAVSKRGPNFPKLRNGSFQSNNFSITFFLKNMKSFDEVDFYFFVDVGTLLESFKRSLSIKFSFR